MLLEQILLLGLLALQELNDLFLVVAWDVLEKVLLMLLYLRHKLLLLD